MKLISSLHKAYVITVIIVLSTDKAERLKSENDHYVWTFLKVVVGG